MTGITGGSKIATVNGRIDASNLSERVELSTVNGSIRLGEEALQDYLLGEIQAVYRAQNVTIETLDRIARALKRSLQIRFVL